MALEQAVELNGTGLEVTYWRIMRVEADFSFAEPGLVVTVYGFASKDARLAGKREVTTRTYRFGVEQLATMDLTLDTLTRAAIYDAVRTVDLTEAVDA